MSDMQSTILKSFFTNDDYMRRVVPFMEPDYFEGVHRTIFKEFVKYVAEYSNTPSLEAFRITMQESGSFNEDTRTREFWEDYLADESFKTFVREGYQIGGKITEIDEMDLETE